MPPGESLPHAHRTEAQPKMQLPFGGILLTLKPLSRVFLTAQWRNLVLLTYRIDAAILSPRLPPGLELDLWKGQTLVSLAGFQFLRTKVLSIPVWRHRDFPEVNLRYYVRRPGPECRRGVVFIKEIVPRIAISTVARLLYSENYVCMPMRWEVHSGESARYEWTYRGRRNVMEARAGGPPAYPARDSLDTFILEHQWGYSGAPNSGCVEYRVERPDWRTYPVASHELDLDAAAVYGKEFVEALSGPPVSVILAEGSNISVSFGKTL
jgi:uncharacterized protein YqjF (DUF2071 family)